MGGGIQFFDIVLFALVAAFLIFRLRSVLGRRDGHEGGYRDPFRDRPSRRDKPLDDDEYDDDSDPGNVIRLPDRGATEPAMANPPLDSDDPLAAGLIRIKLADPEFDEKSFIGGARAAFEMIVGAFAAGDRRALGGLLAPEVLSNFERAIDERESAREVVEHELVGMRPPKLVEAALEGDEARVTVEFVSEQVNVTRDASGSILDGDPNYVDKVTDYWTFIRNVRSPDPNWLLVATRSPD